MCYIVGRNNVRNLTQTKIQSLKVIFQLVGHNWRQYRYEPNDYKKVKTTVENPAA